MENVFSVSLILAAIIVIIGGIAIVQAVNYLIGYSEFSYSNKGIISVVVIIMYTLICGFIGLLYIYAGYDPSVIYVALVLFVIILLVLFIIYCIKNRIEMKKVYLLLFLLYFGMVLYLTIFMRIGTVDGSVKVTVLDDLKQAIMNKDSSMAQHMILNIFFFIPFGYLIPAMNWKQFGKWFFAVLGGFMVSTLIEGTQMIFMLGQADIDDIIANTLGAVIGYAIARFIWQIQKNWKL